MLPIALTIAGSDPGGGAGIQADLKTFHRLGVYGASAVTLITVQNTVMISRAEVLEVSLVRDQIYAVLDDLPPQAAKTGALGSEEMMECIASIDFPCPLVVDPVMVSKHGMDLMNQDARVSFGQKLLPRAALITPNLGEASHLAGMEIADVEDMKDAARRIADLGPAAVLVKGGHLPGDAVDILLYNGRFTEFRAPRISTGHTHGTGCTYSAAITAYLARGESIEAAVENAKRFVTNAITTAPGLGSGAGPLNHWASL